MDRYDYTDKFKCKLCSIDKIKNPSGICSIGYTIVDGTKEHTNGAILEYKCDKCNKKMTYKDQRYLCWNVLNGDPVKEVSICIDCRTVFENDQVDCECLLHNIVPDERYQGNFFSGEYKKYLFCTVCDQIQSSYNRNICPLKINRIGKISASMHQFKPYKIGKPCQYPTKQEVEEEFKEFCRLFCRVVIGLLLSIFIMGIIQFCVNNPAPLFYRLIIGFFLILFIIMIIGKLIAKKLIIY